MEPSDVANAMAFGAIPATCTSPSVTRQIAFCGRPVSWNVVFASCAIVDEEEVVVDVVVEMDRCTKVITYDADRETFSVPLPGDATNIEL